MQVISGMCSLYLSVFSFRVISLFVHAWNVVETSLQDETQECCPYAEDMCLNRIHYLACTESSRHDLRAAPKLVSRDKGFQIGMLEGLWKFCRGKGKKRS